MPQLASNTSACVARIINGAQIVVPLLALLVGYHYLRHGAASLVSQGGATLVVFALLLIGVVAGWGLRYRDLPRSFARLHWLISIAILSYLLLDPADFTVVRQENSVWAQHIAYGYWVAIGCAVLSLLRPSALLYPAFYISLVHASSVAITHFDSDRLASVTLVESAQFLGLGVLFLYAIRRWGSSWIALPEGRARFNELALGCLFIAISLHLSHYFWSGYAKLRVGEFIWSWAADNQTHNLVLSSLYRGTLPDASNPVFTQWLFDTMSANVHVLNVVSVVVQIGAVAAVLHVLVLRALSLLYDAMHIGIFLATGLLLWPWVAINVAILYAVKGIRQRDISWSIILCCLVTLVLGGFQHFGNASRLAWWDMRDITGSLVQIKSDDGRWQDLPLSYFNSHGRVMTLQAGQVQLPGHYSPTGWGATRAYDTARMQGACELPDSERALETMAEREIREQKISAFLQAHHQKLLMREARYSTAHPYPGLRYLNSANDMPEGLLRVADITAYRFVMQSVCLDLDEGQLQKNVVAEDSFIVDVKDGNQASTDQFTNHTLSLFHTGVR